MKKFKNKILFFSSGRSEYSLLEPLLLKLKKKIEVNLLVSGTHLSKKYGYSIKDIKKKVNFVKKFFLRLNVENNSKKNLLINSFKIIKFISKNFCKNEIDAILLIGDRYETCCLAYSFTILNIPIIHIHGGETTKNSLDDIFRDTISRMSYLHFVSHSKHKQKLIKLGIKKNKIFNFGGLGASIISNLKIEKKKHLEKKFKLKFWKKNFIVTFHPEINLAQSIRKLNNIIEACKILPNMQFFFTYPNFDYGADKLIQIIEKNKRLKNIFLIKNFGTSFYSVLYYCNGIIGNSSSAILEAPSLGIFSLNIGNRQHGRLFAKTVLNSNGDCRDIVRKIKKISNLKKLANSNLYYKKNTYSNISHVINDCNFKNDYSKIKNN